MGAHAYSKLSGYNFYVHTSLGNYNHLFLVVYLIVHTSSWIHCCRRGSTSSSSIAAPPPHLPASTSSSTPTWSGPLTRRPPPGRVRLVSWDAAPTRSGEEAASVCGNEGGGRLRERLMPLFLFRAAGRLHGALQHAGSREAGLHPQEGQAQRRHWIAGPVWLTNQPRLLALFIVLHLLLNSSRYIWLLTCIYVPLCV